MINKVTWIRLTTFSINLSTESEFTMKKIRVIRSTLLWYHLESVANCEILYQHSFRNPQRFFSLSHGPRVIKLLQECYSMRNFSSTAAISTALQSASVENLKATMKTTWKGLSKKIQAKLPAIYDIIQPHSNHRDAIHPVVGGLQGTFEKTEGCGKVAWRGIRGLESWRLKPAHT